MDPREGEGEEVGCADIKKGWIKMRVHGGSWGGKWQEVYWEVRGRVILTRDGPTKWDGRSSWKTKVRIGKLQVVFCEEREGSNVYVCEASTK